MSNRVSIQPTKFTNINNGVESDITYGVRVYDDYGNAYCNTWDSIPLDDMELLKKVVEDMTDDNTVAMLDFIVSDGKGLYIGSNWYEREEVASIIQGE